MSFLRCLSKEVSQGTCNGPSFSRCIGSRSVTTYSQYIDGTWMDSSPGAGTIEVENPSTHEILSIVPRGTVEDAEAALLSAKAAQPAWEATSSVERAQTLRKLSELMRSKREELALTLAQEQAKTLGLALVEIDASCAYLDYHVGWARSYEGEILQSDRGIDTEQIYIHRIPLGVSVGICPWNFPVYVLMRKIAPTLVTGNTVVVKLSEYTPNTCFEIAKLFQEAAIPPGVINMVVGEGSTIGHALVDSDIPGIISLTGSVATGQKIMSVASKHLTKLSLELGGKAPVVVMEDCNMDQTVNDIWRSRQLFTGQICNSPERIYVQNSIRDEFIDKLVQKASSTKVGATPTEENIDMCGLVNQTQLEKVSSMVNKAVQEDGAELLLGGKVNDNFETGYHYEPTILTNVKQSDEIMRKEIFGPVLPVMSFAELEEALEYSNDCEYGLTSSIFTNNASAVYKAMTGFKFGETYINRDHFEAIQGFHAGWRKSGLGGCDGKHGLYEYLGTRTVYWNTHK